jgi:putative polyketide hydroxylase
MRNDVPVLIAGGGLVGLSAALFLRDHGVPSLLVEQHAGTSTLPRGRGLNLRAMELFRMSGIEDALRAAPPSILRDLPEIAKAETLAGPELFRTARPAPAAYAGISPTTPLAVDQNAVEPVLREYAERRGAELRFRTELRGFTADGDGVTAELLDRANGRTRRVRADYLIAADGHRSAIRRALGISTPGTGTMARYANIPFEADLSGPLRGRPLALCYLSRPVPNTILTRLDDPRRWVLMVPYEDDLAGFTMERCRELVREAIGVPDLPVTIPRSQLAENGQPQTWELASWVAERYRAGRVLLAGDAAHVTPPAGGLGGNTGIQDAHNLAWKLAAVLAGHAHPDLLDTYEAERRPVAELTGDFSANRQRSRESGRGDGAGELDLMAVSLGYHYRSRAVVTAPGDAARPAPCRDLDGRPGSRAPHVPLRRDGVPVSTLDLYGRRFTLVAGAGADRWVRAGHLAGAAGTDLGVHQIGQHLQDERGGWSAAHGTTDRGAVLVRPDGFVCWRAPDDSGPDPAETLAGVLRRVLCRGAVQAEVSAPS